MGDHRLAAGALLKQARLRAGLSQARLAERAGVTQGVISAYESGRRQPSLPLLLRLIDATGNELRLSVESGPRSRGPLTGPVGRRVWLRREELKRAAARRGFAGLAVFGSVARGEDRPDSDVDLLCVVPPEVGLFALGLVRDELEELVGAPVDLVPEGDLKAEMRDRVADERVDL